MGSHPAPGDRQGAHGHLEAVLDQAPQGLTAYFTENPQVAKIPEIQRSPSRKPLSSQHTQVGTLT